MALKNVIIIVFCQRCQGSVVIQNPTDQRLSTAMEREGGFTDTGKTWLCPECEEKRLALVESNRVAVQDFMAGKTPGKVAT